MTDQDPAAPGAPTERRPSMNEAKCVCGRYIFRPWVEGIQEPWKHWVEPLDHAASPVKEVEK